MLVQGQLLQIRGTLEKSLPSMGYPEIPIGKAKLAATNARLIGQASSEDIALSRQVAAAGHESLEIDALAAASVPAT
jgi:hypothetical protein